MASTNANANGPGAGAAAGALPPGPAAGTRVAIVTGANSGIGLAVCVAFARTGYTVHGGMRATASADALAAAAATAGVADAVHPVRMDVGDDDSVAAAVADVLSVTGDRVDVAVANAGYGGRTSVESVPLGDYQAVMNVNFFGALRLVKAVVPSMRRRGAGRVLGVSSILGVIGLPFFGAYAASKFAMEGCWESSYAEYKALGVHFVLMEPGPVDTPMARRPFLPWSPPPELVPAWDAFATTFVERFLNTTQTPDECASSFVRAASAPAPALRYMTHPPSGAALLAKVVDLDGGRVAATLLPLVSTKGPGGGSTPPPAEAAPSTKE